MEALILLAAALIVIVLLEAGYYIAIGLIRWAPVLVVGVAAFWLAHCHGAGDLEALGLATVACLLARRLLRPRWHYGHADDGILW